MSDPVDVRLLGGPRRYTRDAIAAEAGVTVEQARRYWRALGFPNVGDEAVVFTDADLAALRHMLGLVRDGVVDEEFAVSLTRAFGHTAARLVEWQVESLAEHLAGDRGAGAADAVEAGRRAVDTAVEHVEDLERLLRYAFRRHLSAVAGRTSAGGDAARGWLTVGFADLVSYTRLSQRLEERALALLVGRFETVTGDVVAAGGGRLVKTVGDEVLFVADRPRDAARIALGLAEAHAEDDVLPDVRVGLATGAVVSRQGDVFGRTVNLASRLTAMAPPGAVLVDRGTAAALDGDPELVVDREKVRAVRGLGLVEPGVLRWRAREERPGAASLPG